MSLFSNSNTGMKMTWKDFFVGDSDMDILDPGYTWFRRDHSQEYINIFIKELADEFLSRFPQPSDEIIRALVNEQRRRADDQDIQVDKCHDFKKYFRLNTNIIGTNHLTKTIWFNERVKEECPLIGNPDIFIERELNGNLYKFYLSYVFFTVPSKGEDRCVMRIGMDLVRVGSFAAVRYKYNI